MLLAAVVMLIKVELLLPSLFSVLHILPGLRNCAECSVETLKVAQDLVGNWPPVCQLANFSFHLKWCHSSILASLVPAVAFKVEPTVQLCLKMNIIDV